MSAHEYGPDVNWLYDYIMASKQLMVQENGTPTTNTNFRSLAAISHAARQLLTWDPLRETKILETLMTT